jgi:hypothetical protein
MPHEFHGMGEGVRQADHVERLARLSDAPERVEGGRGEKHREDHEVHHAREILELPYQRGQEQPDGAEHQPDQDEGRQGGEVAEPRHVHLPPAGDGEEDIDLDEGHGDAGGKLRQQQVPARVRAGQQHPHGADLPVIDHGEGGLHAVEELDHGREARRDVDLVEDVGLVRSGDRDAEHVAEAGGEDEQPDQRPDQRREEALLLIDEAKEFPAHDAAEADEIAAEGEAAA